MPIARHISHWLRCGTLLQEVGYFRLTRQTFVSDQQIPFGKVQSDANPCFLEFHVFPFLLLAAM